MARVRVGGVVRARGGGAVVRGRERRGAKVVDGGGAGLREGAIGLWRLVGGEFDGGGSVGMEFTARGLLGGGRGGEEAAGRRLL